MNNCRRASVGFYHYIFRCPDDGNPLLYNNTSLQCTKCGRIFPILSDNLVELLPSKPYPLEAIDREYQMAYFNLLEEKFYWHPSAIGWGHLPSCSVGFRAFVKQECKMVEEKLGRNARGLVCDVAGGAGSYTLKFADNAELVVYCDLDVNAINCAFKQAQNKFKKRIIFVRCDYLQLPLASNLFDSVICIDTLERGISHELRLLTEIIRCLKPGGKAVVDFHNESRIHLYNKIMQSIKFRTKNKVGNYTAKSISRFLSKFCLKNYEIMPFGYVPLPLVRIELLYCSLDRIFQLLSFPPSRFIVVLEK